MWPPSSSRLPIGIGGMRLSTDVDRDDARSIAVLQAALDSGVTLLDTADACTWLNRDADGGSLRGLVPALARLVSSGTSRIVLDNTYVTRKSRAPVIPPARSVAHAPCAAGVVRRRADAQSFGTARGFVD
jgi:hypothetical protein